MVFCSVSSDSEVQTFPPTTGTVPKPPMSFTVSAKSHQQPLHNFPLTGLKWPNSNPTTTTTTNTTTSQHQPRLRNELAQKSPLHDSSSEGVEPKLNDNPMNGLSNERPQSVKKITFSECLVENSEDKINSVAAEDLKSKVLLRLRPKSKFANEAVETVGVQTQKPVLDDVYEEMPKTWNLRPRKPVAKPSSAGGSPPPRTGGSAVQENKTPMQQARPELAGSLRVGGETRAAEKKKNRKFSISLSKQEIEDDIIEMTGSRPTKRPKKRARAVQKQLDNVFPGLWLSSITPDVYRVPDTPIKG
ncbi:uncharacterized protein LOC107424238 [Ziziphus jujuba]|uniref:Uncharacterized protein LOC107424238 n=1 Tax=Ziziphus jujuba TaxID=326968 RepID=A0A6P4ATP7_ZIZJJ|nr:uncharacterized protein LOC107424238 [Ziziphus jujuba]